MNLTPVTYLPWKSTFFKLSKPFSRSQPPFSPDHLTLSFADFGLSSISKLNSFADKTNWLAHKLKSLFDKLKSSSDKLNSLFDKLNSSSDKLNSFSDKTNWLAHKLKSLFDKLNSLAHQPALLAGKLWPAFKFVAAFAHWLAGKVPASRSFGRLGGVPHKQPAPAATAAVRPCPRPWPGMAKAFSAGVTTAPTRSRKARATATPGPLLRGVILTLVLGRGLLSITAYVSSQTVRGAPPV